MILSGIIYKYESHGDNGKVWIRRVVKSLVLQEPLLDAAQILRSYSEI